VLAFENCQLMTQSKIFHQQGLTRAKEPMEEARPKAQEVEHGSNSYQNATLRKFLKLLISEAHGILSNDRYFELIPTMAKHAQASGSPQNNPRVPSASEIEQLYREIWQ